MFLILAVLLALTWVVFFGILHATGPAIHVLMGMAALSALVHWIRPRKYRAAPAALPKDAIK